jgi:hypothetical protein
MSTAEKGITMSMAEYLEWEPRQNEKHAFWNGQVFSQAGGTRSRSLIWQDCARVEQHTKTDEGLWLLREIEGVEKSICLQSLDGARVPLAELYDKVQFAS